MITSNGTPILEEVPVEEEASIRMMQQGQPKPQKGDWVMIPTGPYCCDVGVCTRSMIGVQKSSSFLVSTPMSISVVLSETKDSTARFLSGIQMEHLNG